MNLERKRKLIRPTFLFFGFVICLVFVTGAQSSFAQSIGSATLRGTVRDQQGAAVRDATITLTNERTKDERKATTNDEGRYLFSALTPGSYGIKVEARGFKTAEQSGIALETSSTRAYDIGMEVGQPSETVTVTATGDQIQTETGAKEHTITAKQIENLSIISRSALELLRILPGVVAPEGDQLESVSFGGGANANTSYNVNGLRGQNNNIQIDGSKMIDIGSNNGTIITANPDMVQEVTVQTSNYAAEHGVSGVNISATTKGGSNSFHGEVYDYIRNYRFQANDRSNSIAGTKKPKSAYQYPGGNIGGPVILPWTKFNRNRDKLFFFFGLEFQRQQVDPGTFTAVVPTVKMRTGDFSELLTGAGQNLNMPRTVNVPRGCTVGGVGAGSAAPNNNLAPCIDPVGVALMNLYPAPNFTDANNRYNYRASTLQPTNRYQMIGRFDYNLSNKTKLYTRLAREVESQDFAYGLWWNASNYELPSHVLGTNLGRSAVVNMTSVFSPTMTNEVLFSASRLMLDNDYRDPKKVSLDALGISNFRGIFPTQSPYAPLAIYSWGQGLGNFWEPGGLPLFAHNDSYSVTDNVTKVFKSHAMKFGVFIEQGNKQQNFNGSPEGGIALGGGWTPGDTGNDFGNLLVGRPAQFQQSTATPIGKFRFYNYEGYAQDSWKIKPNFTLEYGVRIAYIPNNTELNKRAVLFDPKAYVRSQGTFINGDKTKPNGFLLASRGEIPMGIVQNAKPQFAPRLNFAWDISGKGDTVIRGGTGLFYNRVMGNYQYWVIQQPPNSYSATADAWGNNDIGGGQGLTFGNLRLIDPYSLIGGISVQSVLPERNRIPRIANMSLSIARRLPGNQILEVAYVGTLGRHLPDQRQIDVIPQGALLKGTVGNADLSVPINRVALSAGALSNFRPFPGYGGIKVYEYAATSAYHSMQATLSRQAGKNLQYFISYTFSKALGTASSDYDEIDPVDARHRSYGVLAYDRTHILNASYNYNLPDPLRGHYDNFLTRALFRGWQVSGISTFSSGQPLRLKFSGDIANNGMARAWFGSDAFTTSGNFVGAIAPVFSQNPFLGNVNKLGGKIFDINSIRIPGFGTTGSYQGPYFRAPNRWNHDVSFFKNFKISETKKIQFRMGLFDIFNQAYPRFNGDNNQSDLDLVLDTRCNVKRSGIPNGSGGTSDNVCDPTGGFTFTQQTLDNFGKIKGKHGHRTIEFALKFTF